MIYYNNGEMTFNFDRNWVSVIIKKMAKYVLKKER